MAIISIYIAGVVLLGIFSLLVMYNYWRYRLEGDHTATILLAFSVAFILVAIGGFFFIQSTATATPVNTDIFI